MISSRFLRYLPAIYQEEEGTLPVSHFLLAFEKVLLGRNDQIDFEYRGLEEIIADIPNLFDPKNTPEEFLEWLAGWIALSLRSDFSVLNQRQFIAEIVKLYKNRGTTENLIGLIKLFFKVEPIISESNIIEIQIGKHATIGKDTYLEGGLPHFFEVIIPITYPSPELVEKQYDLAKAIIDMAKPAHTYYKLTIESIKKMQIGAYSTIGVDAVIG
ncbi:MAG: phage tail protein [bacterium]